MADEQQTVTVTDLHGNEVEVPVGLDGKNPISPNNPAPKAVAEGDREAALEAREAEVKFAEDLTEIAGVDKASATTNMEDNTPVTSDTGTAPDADRTGDEAPNGNASKEEWVNYAVSQGADREDAEAMTRDELRDAYGE